VAAPGSVAVGHRGAARALIARLAGVAHLAIGDWFYTCLGRHLGDAAALLGDPAGARAYYTQALQSAGKIRFRPEIALTHVSLAELLFAQGEKSAAVRHVDFAVPELSEMGMQPGLERAQALSERDPHATAHTPARQTVSDGLTTREREIAGLLAGGLSNRDIADSLVISEATVEVHVKHILSKLGSSLAPRWQGGLFATDGGSTPRASASDPVAARLQAGAASSGIQSTYPTRVRWCRTSCWLRTPRSSLADR
jgi:ATP/maltotriose-dependent transcriptional regulator MalT